MLKYGFFKSIEQSDKKRLNGNYEIKCVLTATLVQMSSVRSRRKIQLVIGVKHEIKVKKDSTYAQFS